MMDRRRITTCSRCDGSCDGNAWATAGDDDVITRIQQNECDVAADCEGEDSRREHHHEQWGRVNAKAVIRPIRGCPHTVTPLSSYAGVNWGFSFASVMTCVRAYEESRRHVALWRISDPEEDKINSKIGAMIARRHPNIVEFIESYMVGYYLWIVTEVITFIHSESLTYFFSKFMSGGCLTDVVSHFPELKLTEHQISYILLCVMKALAHIHGLIYIHRDIKSCNVLLSLDGAVRLADHGKLHSHMIYYMSPELIRFFFSHELPFLQLSTG
ncbi:myosin heavy chain kinase [Pelomyxa schiedti]|nr:myosin heavy chain kinase [Pelomyxa schiedti]